MELGGDRKGCPPRLRQDHSECKTTTSIWGILKACLLTPMHGMIIRFTSLFPLIIFNFKMPTEDVTSQVVSSGISGRVCFIMPLIRPGMNPVLGSNSSATTN